MVGFFLRESRVRSAPQPDSIDQIPGVMLREAS
jgi:hypothetical protein